MKNRCTFLAFASLLCCENEIPHKNSLNKNLNFNATIQAADQHHQTQKSMFRISLDSQDKIPQTLPKFLRFSIISKQYTSFLQHYVSFGILGNSKFVEIRQCFQSKCTISKTPFKYHPLTIEGLGDHVVSIRACLNESRCSAWSDSLIYSASSQPSQQDQQRWKKFQNNNQTIKKLASEIIANAHSIASHSESFCPSLHQEAIVFLKFFDFYKAFAGLSFELQPSVQEWLNARHLFTKNQARFLVEKTSSNENKPKSQLMTLVEEKMPTSQVDFVSMSTSFDSSFYWLVLHKWISLVDNAPSDCKLSPEEFASAHNTQKEIIMLRNAIRDRATLIPAAH